jgi:hypothetical protein
MGRGIPDLSVTPIAVPDVFAWSEPVCPPIFTQGWHNTPSSYQLLKMAPQKFGDLGLFERENRSDEVFVHYAIWFCVQFAR